MISYPKRDQGIPKRGTNRLTWRGTREEKLGQDPEQVHESKRLAEELHGPLGRKDPKHGGENERNDEMHDTVRQPRQYVEDRMRVSGQDVGDVGTV